MRITARKTSKAFWEVHPDAEKALRAWFHEVKAARWQSFQDIKAMYATADVRPNNRVTFNVKGNRYRIIVKIHYNRSIVFIRFMGTHTEYGRIDVDTV